MVYTIYVRKKTKPKIKFKHLLKAFGGAALYIDKQMLKHLQLSCGEEVQIEFKDGFIILSKPLITDTKVQELVQKARLLDK